MTFLLHQSVGLPIAPTTEHRSGALLWTQLVGIGWWILCARAAVGIVRLIVVLEGRPQQTGIVLDLLAGAIYLTTLLAVINFVFAVPIGGLIATSGVIAIVLGLALQSTLSDVFSGIAIGLEHAYKPGDVVSVEGAGNIEGRVLQINWRSTQIETFHNSIAIIPNSIIAKSRFENRSAPTLTRSVTLSVNIDASVDPQRCITALQAAATACRIPLSEPQPAVNCIGLQGDGNIYQFRFTVSRSGEIESARTEALTLIHRHLRYAGIRLGLPGVVPPPPPNIPTLSDLIAESDLLGGLAPDQRGLFTEYFAAMQYDVGQVLMKQDVMPEAIFLIASGTVDVSRTDTSDTRVLLRAGPTDTIGAVPMIMERPALFTATALTVVSAYRLDRSAIAALMRVQPRLAQALEGQARRGRAWIRCETEANAQPADDHPDLLLVRLQHFLHRLSLGI
jgi:small-conductance mechanosensitive channel/CRP-like cAMP-binding protein